MPKKLANSVSSKLKAKLKTERTTKSRLFIIGTIVWVTGCLCLFTWLGYEMYYCSQENVDCADYDDKQHEIEARNTALEYSKSECVKSYASQDCASLIVDHASYFCGVFDWCGWTAYIRSGTDFDYKSAVELTKPILKSGFWIRSYSEYESTHSKRAISAMKSMCEAYEPTRKSGCREEDFTDLIFWRRNHQAELTENTGLVQYFPDHYHYEVIVDRSGKVVSGNITDSNVSGEPVYTYGGN